MVSKLVFITFKVCYRLVFRVLCGFEGCLGRFCVVLRRFLADVERMFRLGWLKHREGCRSPQACRSRPLQRRCLRWHALVSPKDFRTLAHTFPREDISCATICSAKSSDSMEDKLISCSCFFEGWPPKVL